MEGLTLRAVVAELDERLRGARIQQIYSPRPTLIILKLWRGADHSLLIETGQNPRVHLTSEKFRNPPVPSNFTMVLRKYIKNAILRQVTQVGLDRIVDLHICSPSPLAPSPLPCPSPLTGRERVGYGDVEYILRCELLSRQANVIFLNGPKILGALKAVVGQRTFRPGSVYPPPPAQAKLDPRSASATDFYTRLSEDMELTKALLNALDGIGPRLAKELALRVGLDPARLATTLTDAQKAALWEAAQKLFDSVEKKHFAPCCYLLDDKPVDAAPFPLKIYEHCTHEPRASLSAALDDCCRAQTEESAFAQELASLKALLRAKLSQTRAVIERVARDLEKTQDFESLKREGELLLANLGKLKRGLTEVALTDFLDSAPRTIKLDPALSPSENAQKKFERYKKLRRGQEKLQERRTELQHELQYLENVASHLQQAESEADLTEIRQELQAQGYLPQKPLAHVQDQQDRDDEARAEPREFLMRGYRVLVGRSSKQNDELIRNASREDYWLHARDRAGAHVVIKNPQQREIPPEVLTQAAQLAAYYSKGRESSKVPVSFTRIKYLRKPKGSRPGLVLMTQEEGTLLVPPKGDF